MTTQLTLVVLISGNGSNLQAIIDSIDAARLNANIAAVISNRADVYGLKRAQAAKIETLVVGHQNYSNRQQYDAVLGDTIARYHADLIVLAGFMRILSATFIARFKDKIINIHPSLLPALKGTHTHQRAIEAGYKEHGASVHVVTEALDNGPVLAQARVPVYADDTAESLAARVLAKEQVLYPQVIQAIADGKLQIKDGAVIIAASD